MFFHRKKLRAAAVESVLLRGEQRGPGAPQRQGLPEKVVVLSPYAGRTAFASVLSTTISVLNPRRSRGRSAARPAPAGQSRAASRFPTDRAGRAERNLGDGTSAPRGRQAGHAQARGLGGHRRRPGRSRVPRMVAAHSAGDPWLCRHVHPRGGALARRLGSRSA
ncbi:hypothetical protein QJS66_12250 [Kocuria rhizophila]|nr:hypothetical protein QJS66_12250 [Kocuria rhizophila]